MTPDGWKIAGMIIAAFASVAGILGALYGIVTVPVLRTVKAEISASEERLKTKLAELKTEIVEMEKRLNERIDSKLVHR